MTILINGNPYDLTDKVSWEDAEAEGGFYYARARHLGMPRPTALLFKDGGDDHVSAAADYHERFRDAEAAMIADIKSDTDL